MTETPARPLAFVVEDDELIGQMLRFLLERAGYAVQLAGDGHAAQAYIESGARPAFCLLDVMLPHVDGYTLLALARRRAGWEGVPVLMLSAKSQERDVARALEAGADGYVVKPFQPEELLARIARVMPPAG